MRPLRFLAVVPFAILAGGCAAEAVRNHAAFDFDCPASQIEVWGEGYHHYEAIGCGQRAEFVCIRHGCVREGEVHGEAYHAYRPIPLASTSPTSFDESSARATVAPAAGAAADACRDESGPHGAGQARVTFAPSGRVWEVVLDERFDGSATGECVRGRLRTARIPAFQGAAETVEVPFFVAAGS